jgi:hypothetical protein
MDHLGDVSHNLVALLLGLLGIGEVLDHLEEVLELAEGGGRDGEGQVVSGHLTVLGANEGSDQIGAIVLFSGAVVVAIVLQEGGG